MHLCSYELLQHNFRKKILSVKMSDIENRPPTSVLATKTGPKDSNIKPKEIIVKPKVKLIVFSSKMTNISMFSRIIQVLPAEKSFKPCSRPAKTRLCWWVYKHTHATENYPKLMTITNSTRSFTMLAHCACTAGSRWVRAGAIWSWNNVARESNLDLQYWSQNKFSPPAIWSKLLPVRFPELCGG